MSEPDAETARRADLVRRWRRAQADGLTVKDAAAAVGVAAVDALPLGEAAGAVLHPPARRPPAGAAAADRGPRAGAEEQFPAWGRGKIAAMLQREGIRVSGATVGRAIRGLVRRGLIAPVSAFTAFARRRRRARRPQAVQVDTLSVALRPGRTVRHFTGIDRLSRWSAGMAASDATAASAARFLDKLIGAAPFTIEAVQVDGGSEFMADFEAACAAKGVTLAVLPPKSPKMNGRVERMQATLRNELFNVQETAVSVTGLNPLIDRYLDFYNGERPHDALDGMTPDEYLESRRIGEAPPSHMS